jgi:hypothetical protein
MTMLKIQSTKKNEKGIALIFSLIMLSLLLILALSFTMDSMFEQKAAYNSASSSSSGFMGQTQLKQVLLLMENDQANFDSSRLYSHDLNDFVSFDMLLERLPVSGVLEYDPDNPTDPDKNDKVFDSDANGTYNDPKVNWNYIRSGPNATDPIIGRTAFVVVPKEKIPFNSLISKTVDESGNATSGVYDEKRIGKDVSEINIRNAMYIMTAGDNAATYTITPAMADILNWLKTETDVTSNRDAGKFTGTWFSYSSIFGTSVLDLDYNISNATDRAKFKQNFINSFELDSEQDQEAFWADIDGDTKRGSSEFFKRFDLTRDDWDIGPMSPNYVMRVLLLTPSGTVPTTPMEAWKNVDSLSFNDDSTNYSRGLPWLACFGYKADGTAYTTDLDKIKGTFTGTDAVYNRRCQIAANLKDYCDTDDIPNSNEDPSGWLGSTAPMFTGNERTPYINKIGIRVESTLTNAPPDVWGDIAHTITVNIKPYVGLIDIYRDKYKDDVYAFVDGSVTVEVSFNGGAYVPLSCNIKNSSSITIAGTSNWAVASNGHSIFAGGLASLDKSTSKAFTSSVSATVRVKNVTINKVVLYDDSDDDPTNYNHGYDYVKNLSLIAPSPSDIVAFQNSATVATPTTEHCWLGFEVNDPRQNLNPGDWVSLTPVKASLASSCFAVSAVNYGKANADNINSTYSGSPDRVAPNTVDADLYDLEAGTDPAAGSLSTAFIRNAPMESPWELGFIHRGKMWQTLNLKKYDSSKGIRTFKLITPDRYYIAGGGLYKDGDANILDQVKMTKSAKSPEKINITTQKEGILNALFSQIQLGCTIVRDNTPTFDPAVHMTVDSMAINGTTTPIDLTASTYTATVAPKGMRTKIIELFASPDTTTFTNLTRASAADELASFTAGTTDAEQEELIGKMINLTKIGGQSGSGSFSIIVLAQSIKDVGTSSGIKIYKYSDDGTPGNQLCTLGVFDAYTSPTDSDKHIYYDEITAEQKIITEVNRNSDNSITVKSFQYIE